MSGTALPRFFDFHIHTRASDGSRSAAEVLRLAAGAGIEGISITDHDTVDAYHELRKVEAAAGSACTAPWLLAGVEISTRLGEDEAHILGYFPGGISPETESFIEEVLSTRSRRISDGIVRLRERGIDISWAECARQASGRVVSRSHMAQVLVEKRYIGRLHRAYADLLGPKMIPLPAVEAAGAVREIARLGGIAVWAHPAVRQVEEHLAALQAEGLAGVEVIIPRRSPRERRALAKRVRAAGLLVTGGSDWHGKPSGPDFGEFRVGEENVAELLGRIGK